ncbi:hypothetical protein CEXT_10381 [Caerostris extrusa]|uniref:Uncharacterized protein n=1 Tax=Caerostris extrusa TaxID=172846 RepID=A0AAV4RNT7_CAEEX|nr:hypothetical protein CEXT_10381 [Caerostris extrusa]
MTRHALLLDSKSITTEHKFLNLITALLGDCRLSRILICFHYHHGLGIDTGAPTDIFTHSNSAELHSVHHKTGIFARVFFEIKGHNRWLISTGHRDKFLHYLEW